MILFPGRNSRCPRCDLPCEFVDLFHWRYDLKKMYLCTYPCTLLVCHILRTLLCFCLGCKYAGSLFKFVDIYTVCISFLFLYIEIRNREVRVIGAYRHTTYDSFSFLINPLYYKHHCVPCKYVLFSADSDEALYTVYI